MPRYCLRTTKEDDAGVRTHEHAGVGSLAEQRIEQRAVEPVLDRVGPHEDAVQREQLCPHRVDAGIVVHDRLRRCAEGGERGEDAAELGRRGILDGIPLSPPQEADACHAPIVAA